MYSVPIAFQDAAYQVTMCVEQITTIDGITYEVERLMTLVSAMKPMKSF